MMLSIKRLSKKFGKQSLSEVKPAPPGFTVDHTTSPSSQHSPEDLKRDTSDSSDSECEEIIECTKAAPSIVHKNLSSTVKMERVPSAEKRSYRQYKYSTGSSSSGSSSDDEIKEAFEGHTHLHYSPLPIMKSSVKPNAWDYRPHKAMPVGHKKPKYFAQMSSSNSERPRLDFNKMQHSKRLVVVRRPLVLRSNSKVHAIPRPPSLEVSLDISAVSFQPVLMQT